MLKLLDAVIFNAIAGNADAHGKNFSILHGDKGPSLAPLYDLLATVAWPDLSPRFAMKIEKRATLAELDAKGWIAFAADAGLGLPLIRTSVEHGTDFDNAGTGRGDPRSLVAALKLAATIAGNRLRATGTAVRVPEKV